MLDLHIKGVQKVSLIDYPGKISTVVFLNRCNMRCPYCHNPELVLDNNSSEEFPDISIEEFSEFLDHKRKWIDGVCITGGEPTLHNGLLEFMKMIKDLGLLVKLDTNGTNPAIIEQAIQNQLVDYIAMDIKGTLEKYDSNTNSKVNIENIQKSINLIISSGDKGLRDYEFRPTILPSQISEDDIRSIGELLKGSKKYVLQQFHAHDALVNPEYSKEVSYTHSDMHAFKTILEQTIPLVEIRD